MTKEQAPKTSFDPVTLEWDGERYTVQPEDCMGMLARIEAIVAPPGSGQSTIVQLSNPHQLHLTALARSFGAALRYAGAEVTDEAVYLQLSRDMSKGSKQTMNALVDLSSQLLALFFPDWAKDETLADGEGAPGNGEGAAPSHGE